MSNQSKDSPAGDMLPALSDVLPVVPAPVAVTQAPGAPAASSPASPLSDGPAVSGYEILAELGRGGMGVVYKARQLSLNRLVALKMILSAEHAGAAQLGRFRTEAEALARLEHANVVRIYEVGEHRGLPFFSLELVEAGSLDRKLGGVPQPAREAGQLIEVLARAVHAAHQKGVVHRDLKPANVLLASDGTPKVTDFGLAKTLDAGRGHTQTGQIMGTPSYMAPEQAGGKGQEVGPAADVYALGAILYELLTGRPPFLAAKPLDTVMQVLADEPVAPRRLQPKVSRDLETICLKCLEKEPRKRYASALALAEDLRRFGAGEPIQARPAGLLERAVKWARRRPAVAALSALVVLVAVVGLAGVTVAWLDAAEQRRATEDRNEQLTRTRDDLQKANLATKREADAALTAKHEAERNGYFSNVALARQLWQGNAVPRAVQALDRCPAEFRKWEWHYLRRLCRTELSTYPWQTGRPLAVVLGPGGQYAAAVDAEDGSVRVWETTSGKELLQPLPARSATGLAFHKDGKQLAMSRAFAIAVLDLDTQKEAVYLQKSNCHFHCVVFTGDSRLLAAGYAKVNGPHDVGEVEVWDVKAGRRILKVAGFRAFPKVGLSHRAMTLSLDGRHLAALAADSGMRGEDKEPQVSLEHVPANASKPRPKPQPKKPLPPEKEDKRKPVPLFGAQIKVWDVEKGREVRTLDGMVDSQTDLAFSPDGRLLAWGNGAAVALLDLAGEQTPRMLAGHQHDVRAVAFSPDGKRLASGSEDTAIKLWDVQTGTEEFSLRGHNEPVLRVAFAPDGTRLASCAGTLLPGSGVVKVWDATANPEALTERGPAEQASFCLALDAARRRYVTLQGKILAGDGPRAMTVSLRQVGKERAVFQAPFDKAETMPTTFSPDGLLLAGLGRAKLVLFDARTGAEKKTLALPRDAGANGLPVPLAFSRDGKNLAAAWVKRGQKQESPPEMMVRVWDVATGQPLPDLSRPIGEAADGAQKGVRSTSAFVTALAFHPDGKQLAVGATVAEAGKNDKPALRGELLLWDLPTRRLVATRAFPDLWVGLAYSKDGRLLAAGGGSLSEGMAVVWDNASGKLLFQARGHVRTINAVTFNPDGSRLVTGGGDGALKFWDVATGQEVLTLRGHRRSITTIAFSPDGQSLLSGTGLDFMEMQGIGTTPANLRIPLEVMVWDARR